MLNRVLLVDDSKSARFALRKLLEKTGLEVDVAESAEEALGYLNDNHPDVIFMDHFMPGMDGFQATEEIKQRPERSAIPIIMCTSKEDPDYVEQARAHGALDILPKPATPEALSNLLTKLGDMDASNESMAPVDEPVATADVVEMPATANTGNPAQLDEQIAKIVADQLQQRLPEMRETVLSEFDKVAKSVLDGYMQQALSSVKHEFLDSVENESRRVADQSVTAKVDELVSGQVEQIESALKRDINAQLADIYSDLGELKSNQQLKTLAPELEKQISRNARQVADETANTALARVRSIAEDATKQALDSALVTTSKRLTEETEATVDRALENGLETARKDAKEVAWQELADFQNSHNAAMSKLYLVAGVAAVCSVVALAGVALF